MKLPLVATGSMIISAFLVLGICRPCIADDDGDIQAVITNYEIQQGFTQPGIFHSYQVIESYPYASVQASLGTDGMGSLSAALSETTGQWVMLGQGGGLLGISEFLTLGIPASAAKKLQGTTCPIEPLRNPGPNFSTTAAPNHELQTSGLSRWPHKVVRLLSKGRRVSMTIYKPMSMRVCLL